METELRLAERQGLLTGPDLSPVQEAGIEALLIIDKREAARDAWDEVKRAMVAARPDLLGVLFPEIRRESARFRRPEDRVDRGVDIRPAADAPEDPTGVTYQFEGAPSEAEAARILAMVSGGMSASPDELDGAWR